METIDFAIGIAVLALMFGSVALLIVREMSAAPAWPKVSRPLVVERKQARGRWRFSLLTLLLMVGLTMAVLSHAWTSWQLYQLQQRDDGLVIGSADRVYVRMMRESSADLIRQRVYLPPGHGFYLHVATTNVYDEPIVPESSQSLVNVTGEFVVDIIRQIDDPPSVKGETWEIRCHRYENPVTALFQSMKVTLDKWNHPSSFNFSRQIRQFEAGDRAVLFKSTQPVGPNTPPDGEQGGLLVWIDKHPPPQSSSP